jgi:hypothetical protein
VTLASSKARLAGLVAHRDPADPDITAARGDLAVAWIERKLAEAPPLTEYQLARIRAALPPAGGDHAAT